MTKANYTTRYHDMPFGTTLVDGRFKSSIWAPDADRVDFCLYQADGPEVIVPMTRGGDGTFNLNDCPQAKVGDFYHFIINSGLRVPDPASRHQQKDVHSPSQITDPSSYKWKDTGWRGRKFSGVSVYELHVGTFTPEGTLKAATKKLKYLKRKGWKAVELMPIAENPGFANWGYDLTLLYAIQARYGTPEDLKDFVQEAHRLGLLVYLDCVWNHLGAEGNYLYCYAKSYFNPKIQTPWGADRQLRMRVRATVHPQQRSLLVERVRHRWHPGGRCPRHRRSLQDAHPG